MTRHIWMTHITYLKTHLYMSLFFVCTWRLIYIWVTFLKWLVTCEWFSYVKTHLRMTHFFFYIWRLICMWVVFLNESSQMDESHMNELCHIRMGLITNSWVTVTRSARSYTGKHTQKNVGRINKSRHTPRKKLRRQTCTHREKNGRKIMSHGHTQRKKLHRIVKVYRAKDGAVVETHFVQVRERPCNTSTWNVHV